MKTIYKPKDLAALLGVTVRTLQRWDNDGKLKAYRNPKNRRYYTHEQYEELMGIEKENKEGKNVLYARVSNRSQKDDLANQVEFLRTFVNARGLIVDEVIEDVGSGLNYKREKWNRLLNEVMDRKVGTIFVTHQDRFIRFGFDWFKALAQKFGADIVVVNHEKLSPQEELVQDLISIIHDFSCRIPGLRKYKGKIEKDRELC